ncbi:Mor transcription activator family protein [Herminiimonas arsenitoxidans]|uniref:Mor transcription activator family protein n=1 Tax=Herminiimonas arsenitoxidans TaxID=1809410 RepID=UPI0009713E27|nr:Mor transcription activator family protein [Herminiimonas arsenitoxidans]
MSDTSSLMIDDSYPELLADIAREVYSHLKVHPKIKLQHQDAAEIAMSVSEHVRKNIGGVGLYLPKGVHYEASLREQEIYKDFKGDNFHILVRKYGLTEMRIRQIVTKVGNYERAKRQQNLFATE